MEEKKLTERESLELITTMIKRTRERYIGDGNIMLMWGYLSVVVAALVWIMLVKTHNPVWNWLWFAIGVVGGIATPIMSKKSELKSGAKSYSDKITSQIWTVVGISAFVATLFCRDCPGYRCEGEILHLWRCSWPVHRNLRRLLHCRRYAIGCQLVPADVYDCLRLHDDHPGAHH